MGEGGGDLTRDLDHRHTGTTFSSPARLIEDAFTLGGRSNSNSKPHPEVLDIPKLAGRTSRRDGLLCVRRLVRAAAHDADVTL